MAFNILFDLHSKFFAHCVTMFKVSSILYVCNFRHFIMIRIESGSMLQGKSTSKTPVLRGKVLAEDKV